MKETIQIFEYDKLEAIKDDGFKVLDEKNRRIGINEDIFNSLKSFILENKSENEDTEVTEVMGLSVRRGYGETITAQNYVGVLSMDDGTIIEILPKIFSKDEEDIETKYKKSKSLLLEMIKTLHDPQYKFIQKANLNVDKLDIFEIFIRMFVDEVINISKRGLRCDYVNVEENANFLKGKLLFSQHVKANFAHAERFYISYDVFSANRPENRLIKSTLLYLYRKTKDLRNKKDIKNLLNSFDEIEESTNYDMDFSKVSKGRDMKDYANALIWCRVFLMGKSFTSFAGSTVSYALLFPMEKLFESYFAAKLEESIDSSKYEVTAQDRDYFLFDDKFRIKPDVVVDDIVNKKCHVILDTKWKLLSKDNRNYGISQGDMYQMYAYGRKYKCENIFLVYPQTIGMGNNDNIKFESNDADGVNITVCPYFVDFEFLDDAININKSINALIKRIDNI